MLSLQFTYSLTQKLCPLFFCYKFNKLRTQMLAISQVSLCLINLSFNELGFGSSSDMILDERREMHTNCWVRIYGNLKTCFTFKTICHLFQRFCQLNFPGPRHGTIYLLSYVTVGPWIQISLWEKKKDTTTFLGISHWVFSRQPHPMTAGANC